MKRSLVIAASLALASCEKNQTTAKETDSSVRSTAADTSLVVERVAGLSVVVDTSDGCTLRYGLDSLTSELRLGITPPCALHRDQNGAVRTRKVGDALVFLVESSSPDPQHPGTCNTEIRGVIVAGDRVSISNVLEHVAMCAPFQWDDVMFIGLSKPDRL
ncbi:MAG: hypothetical protein Q8K82_05670 [Gemmatimonadaceae bacterium]|nr:hypothetical protein [Gemmatimonadaceae bacterium]